MRKLGFIFLIWAASKPSFDFNPRVFRAGSEYLTQHFGWARGFSGTATEDNVYIYTHIYNDVN